VGLHVPALKSLRDLASLASLALKTLFAALHKRTAVLFPPAKKYRCAHFLGQLVQIYPGVQLLFRWQRGKIEWKPKYENAQSIERCVAALSADAHCSVPPSRRSPVAGRPSLFTIRSSLVNAAFHAHSNRYLNIRNRSNLLKTNAKNSSNRYFFGCFCSLSRLAPRSHSAISNRRYRN
jgi:hypothetical protein